MTEILYKELSYRVIGCAQRVHSVLGPGFPEQVYHRALCLELVKEKIPFSSEVEMDVAYEGVTCGQFRADIVVDEKIILELKAIEIMVAKHAAQMLAYLKASGLSLGILMNFADTRLQTKRIVNQQ
ncbi:MAG: GxxExxY protein [Phycisphaerae bacterium]|nr:GxxExxY protein [Phycisphaerae bacterium]